MFLNVVHKNGLVERITVANPMRWHEGESLNRLITLDMEYFFDKDGYYDGYGMNLPNILEKDAEILLRNEEERRVFKEPPPRSDN